jgi:hypothetical protein
MGEDTMRLTPIVATLAVIGGLGFTASADAAPRQRVVTNSGNTVYVTRDENGRARTRIIIQKRSYLDPGTEQIPGERSVHEYGFLPTQHASDVLDNTIFGGNQSPLPGPFTLPGKRNPWLGP